MTYESHVIRHRDELTKMSQGVERYGAEYYWHFGLSASAWSVADIGLRVFITALYICRREGRLHQLEGESEAKSEEKRRGICMEYWYIALTGMYMRRRWISPFDLWGHSRDETSNGEVLKSQRRMEEEK